MSFDWLVNFESKGFVESGLSTTFFKMVQYWPLFLYFCLFYYTIGR